MQRPSTVVGLGDSICYGIGDLGADWIGPSWVGRFAHAVNADRVVNLATPGQRAADLTRIQLPAALLLRPTIALISVGGNDLLRADFDPVSLWRHTQAAVAQLTHSGTDVLVLGLPQVHTHDFLPTAVRRALTERADLVNVALRAAVGVGVPGNAYFLDLWNDPQSADPSLWHIDRMHPSPTGHDYLARVSCALLRTHHLDSGLPVDSGDDAPPAIRWLIRHGVPWVLRRSVDLIPQALVTLAFHRRHYQQMRRALHAAIASSQTGNYGIAESPPSTINSWPVMNDEASLAKNAAA
jgi:lysophospholipase L1-like esterase